MNEILLYHALDADTASYMIQYLSWIGENQVYATRMYCPGGDVEATWGIPAKMQELKLKGCHSIAKVDGMAASMAGVLLCFFDEREALEVSNIMIHRATYGLDPEGKPIVPSPEEKIRLAKINNDIKTRLAQVINNGKLKQIKGYGLDELFDESKERIDCWLTAVEAKEVGLITKVIAVDANTSQYMAKAVAACWDPSQKPKATAATAGKTNVNKMTAEEFKKENPEAYEAIRKGAAADAVKALKAKAKAALEDEDPEDPEMMPGKGKGKASAQVDANVIALAVEQTLKAMGVQKIEAGQPAQTAAATATQTAQAEADKKAKDEADKKVMDDLKSEISNIVAGKA